jgi:TonB family protein
MVLSISTNRIIKTINLPLIASIGVHSAFFMLVFPKWNGNANLNNQISDNTPVVELNQLEQTRLPNTNSNNNAINWNILEGLPNNNQQNMSLNIPQDTFRLPQVNSLALPNSNINVQNLPSIPQLPPPVSFNNSNISPLPIPNNSLNRINSNNFSNVQLPPPPITETNNQNVVTKLPLIKDLDFDNQNQQITKKIDLTVQQEEAIRQQIFANNPIQINPNPRDVINGRNPNSNSPQTINPLSTNTDLIQQRENTTDEEARKNYVAWITKVQNVQPKQMNVEGIYPQDACVKKLEGITAYGVTVNSTGEVTNTELIKSSGYSLFNNKALNQIKTLEFTNNTGVNQPYHVYVNFQYDAQICSSFLGNDGNNTPTIQNNNPPVTNPQQKTSTVDENNQKSETNPAKITPDDEKTKTLDIVIPNNNSSELDKNPVTKKTISPENSPNPIKNKADSVENTNNLSNSTNENKSPTQTLIIESQAPTNQNVESAKEETNDNEVEKPAQLAE